MLIRYYLLSLFKNQTLIIISMATICSLTFSLFIGFGYTSDNFKKSIDSYFDEYKLANIYINTDLTQSSSYDCLKSVNGVVGMDARFSSIFNVSLDKEYFTVLLSSFSDNDYSKMAYMSEKVDSSLPGIMVDQHFADIHNIKPGDKINVGLKNHYCECNVSQIILRPETYYLQIFDNTTIDNIDYGSVYIEQDQLATLLKSINVQTYGMNKNQALLYTDSSYNTQEILDNCKNVLSDKVKIESSLTDKDNAALNLKDQVLSQTYATAQSVPFAFLVIMSLIFILFLVQIIKKQTREIGILLGFGHKRISIYFVLALFTLSICIFSLIVGSILSIIMAKFSYNIFVSGVYLPEWSHQIFIDKFVFNCIIIILVGQLACAISAISFIKCSPIDALEKPYSGFKNLGKSLETLLYKIPTNVRLALNSIIQNTNNFVIIAIGFIASFVMIFSALSIYFSMKEYVDFTYDVLTNYDAEIWCADNSSPDAFDQLKSNNNIKKLEVYDSAINDISFNGNTETTEIIDFTNNSDMIKLKDSQTNNFLEIPDDGIIIDKHMAEKLNVKVGDYVRVGDSDLEVKATTALYVEHYQIVSPQQMSKLNIEKTVFALASANNLQELKKACANSEDTLYLCFANNLKQMQIDWKSPLSIIIDIIVLISILLGFVVVCTISKMSLDKQIKTISILKCQGMQVFSISNYWLLQIILQLIIAYVVGCPIAAFAGKSFVSMLSSEDSYYPFIDEWWIYLLAFSFIVIFAFVVHLIVVYIIHNIEIAKNVQSRE